MIYLILFFSAFVLFTTYLFFKLNKYIEKLEGQLLETKTIIENIKQSLKTLLVDETFLLDDGKIKKTIYEKEKKVIYNGSTVEERGIEF